MMDELVKLELYFHQFLAGITQTELGYNGFMCQPQLCDTSL
jgi:hypothetical protein